MRGRLALCLVAVCVVGAAAAIAYLWPPSSPGRPDEPAPTANVELPSEPESIDVDALRKEAIRGAEELTGRYPRSAAAQRTAATLHQFLKQYDEATRHWKACLALDPKNVEARVSLATVHLLVGRDREARDLLTAALAEGARTRQLYEQLVEALSRTGELDQAERTALDGARQFPRDANLWVAAAQVQLERNRLDEAQSSIDAALRAEPNSGQALFLAANVYARLGKSAEAEAHRRQRKRVKDAVHAAEVPFEEEYGRSLRSAITLLFTAMAMEYHAQGEGAQAEHFCRRAIALDPKSLEPHGLLVSVYRAGGQLPNALVVQRRLVDLEPANVVNRINFASLALALGRLDEGEEALHQAARMAPRNALVRRTLAALYLQRQELDKARAAAEHAVSLEPSLDGYRLLADICRLQGDAAAADAAAGAAVKLQEETARVE